jgi:beta-glucanase (GH16 family)
MTTRLRISAMAAMAAIATVGSLTAVAGPAAASFAKVTPHVWVQTLDEEFNGSSLNTGLWTPQLTASSNFRNANECYVNSPNNIAVSNGMLQLTVRKEAAPFFYKSPAGGYTTQYTAGSVSTIGRFSQTYGKFEVRAKFPATTTRGLQSSFWLWPNNMVKYGSSWPWSGEIDIAEEYSTYADRAVPYLHYAYDPATVDTTTNTNIVSNYSCLISNVNAFHEYAVEWTPGTMRILYDGTTCLVDNYRTLGASPFDQPFFVALTAALGQGKNAVAPASTPLPATTQIDWVRVWE